MDTFSERYSHVKKSEILQLRDIDERLSNLLANHLNQTLTYYSQQGRIKEIEETICNNLALRNDSFVFTKVKYLSQSEKYMQNRSHSYRHDHSKFNSLFDNLKWHEKYTVLETVLQETLKDHPSDKLNIIEPINKDILEREKSAYRLDNRGKLIPIADKVELQSIEETRNHSKQKVVDHFEKAVSLFSDRENPNYPKAVNESLCALELLAQELSGNKNMTLGHAIKQLQNVPKALQDGTSKIYGYAK